jgi:hypothetical protein
MYTYMYLCTSVCIFAVCTLILCMRVVCLGFWNFDFPGRPCRLSVFARMTYVFFMLMLGCLSGIWILRPVRVCECSDVHGFFW